MKLIYAVLSFYPILYITNFIISIVVDLVLMNHGYPANESTFGFGATLVMHKLCIFDMILITILFLLDVSTNSSVKKDHRIPWVVVLIFFNVLAAPVYWYKNIYQVRRA